MSYRRADYEDLPEILKLGSLSAQQNLPGEFDYEGTKELLTSHFLRNTDFFLLGKDWIFIAVLTKSLFLKELVAQEIALFRDPNSDSRIPLLAIMRDFEAWATKRGCRFIVHSLIGPEPRDSFLLKRGFARTDTTYSKELAW